MKRQRPGQRRSTWNLTLTWLVAGATMGALAVASPGVAAAAIGGNGTPAGGAARAPGAGHGGTTLLAAKKKKKKRKAPSGGASTGGGGGDDSSDSGSDDSAAAASGGGASDHEVQKAARGAPSDDGSSGGGSDVGDRPVSRKHSAVTIEDSGSAAPAAEGPAQRFLDLAIGGSGFTRGLTYNQLVKGNLREYQPRFLGGATAAILYYPGAQFSSGFVANLGLDINVSQAFGITSKTPDGTSFATAIHDYNGGVRARLPLYNVEPSLTVGFGDSSYSFSGGDRTNLLLPDVHYQYVRAVIGLHATITPQLSVFASGGYRHVLSVGQIKDSYFTHLTAHGAEANAYAAYAFTSMIEARLGVDFRRYFYSMHSTNADMYIAGCAVDQTIAGSLALAVLLGGTEGPRSASSRSSDEAPPPSPSSSDSGSGESEVKAKPKKRRKPSPDSME